MDTIKPAHYTIHHNLNAIKAIKKGWDITMKSPLKFFFGTFVSFIPFLFVIMIVAYFILFAIFNGTVDIYIILSSIVCILFTDYIFYIIFQKVLLIYNNHSKLNEINKDQPYHYQFDWFKFLRFIMLSLISIILVSGIILLTVFGRTYSILILILLIYYILIKISISILFTLDKNLSILESIKMSWSATHNNLFQILFLIVLVLFVTLLGASCLFIGVGITMPIIIFATVDAYKQMIGEDK